MTYSTPRYISASEFLRFQDPTKVPLRVGFVKADSDFDREGETVYLSGGGETYLCAIEIVFANAIVRGPEDRVVVLMQSPSELRSVKNHLRQMMDDSREAMLFQMRRLHRLLEMKPVGE